MKALLVLSLLCVTAVLSACAGLTQMQNTAAKFDQAVHSASSAELGLLNQVRAAECIRDFYVTAFNFATATLDRTTNKYEPTVALDLTATTCVHKELTDKELKIRQDLLSAITLYADAIQTLTNGTSDTSLNSSATTLAGNIKSLAKQEKFPAAVGIGAAALNTAVVTLATMILDHANYQDVKAAAVAMQGPLSEIVCDLKLENKGDAAGLISKEDGLSDDFNSALRSARDQFGPESFLDVVFARRALQSTVIAVPNIVRLNKMLDGIVSANAALARSTNGGAIPEISDLVSRAKRASALFNASK